MKKTLKVLFVCFIVLPLHYSTAFAGIKQNTVENYLRQQKELGRKPNHLINQSSPYLLQHAYNPVNWYPWGNEAFARAKKENKPIFLSIGYSTCHWCHVMEHESFENKVIARYLNKHFISIKVDREERPDIDAVYMSATQLINGSGGWPMSVFVDDQLRPFHAATYYPPFSTAQHIGLLDVLKKINKLWNDEPQRIRKVAIQVTNQIKQMAKETSGDVAVKADINEKAMQDIRSQFDADMGGFGVAPKFPKPGISAFLIHEAKANNKFSEAAKKMLSLTLDSMAWGGFYDQVGGGFHRYSVDEAWRVPHFEKMLYSQALMALTYMNFYTIENKPRYKQVVTETLGFVAKEMQSPQGGFYSALDADSEQPYKPGKYAEGAYYLWTQTELKKILNKEEFAFIHDYYGIYPNGNIASDPGNEFGKGNILSVAESFRDQKLSEKQKILLYSARLKLNAARILRPRPHLDDKIITAWNGMMISAYARAARVFPEDKAQFLLKATTDANFIYQHLRNKKTGNLYRRYRNGRAGIAAALNDYAWLIKGFLEIYKVNHVPEWLQRAERLTKKQDNLFLDKNSGAYYEAAKGDTEVLFRSKSAYDGALPAANAIVMANMKTLSHLASDRKDRHLYSEKENKIRHAFAAVINANPAATAMMLAN